MDMTDLIQAAHESCPECDGSGNVLVYGERDDCPNTNMHMAIARLQDEQDGLVDQHLLISRDQRIADMKFKLDSLNSMHSPTYGENDRGTYTICGYDKTEWPCRTACILDGTEWPPVPS